MLSLFNGTFSSEPQYENKQCTGKETYGCIAGGKYLHYVSYTFR